MHTLNNTVWLKLAPSPINGVGVFAIRDIPKGQKLYCYPNEKREYYRGLNNLLPEVKELIIQQHPYAESDFYISPNDVTIMICYMNHADEPNYDHINDIALRDIKKGEEVTEKYPNDVKELLEIK